MAFGREKIEYKTAEQVAGMRRAGLVVADAHAAVRAATRPGATTGDLDAVAALNSPYFDMGDGSERPRRAAPPVARLETT